MTARPSTRSVPLDAIRGWLDTRTGARTVLATGCFDLLHVGHLYFLEQASLQGDLLIVGINSDRSVRALKGPDRPIVGEHDRAALVSALRWVDRVFLYDEPAADTQIRLLRPDVFVAGQESVAAYPGELAAAADAGARVHTIGRVGRHSTTTLVDTLRTSR